MNNNGLKIFGKIIAYILLLFVVFIIVGSFFSDAPLFKATINKPYFWFILPLGIAILTLLDNSKLLTIIEKVLRILGQLAALLLLCLMIIITYEVISRYAYNSPTIWAWIVNLHIWLIAMITAGVFAFQEGSHIRIEVLYESFNPKLKKFVKYLTLFLFWCFAISLLWKGYYLAEPSVRSVQWGFQWLFGFLPWPFVGGEIARGPFPMPIWPFKLLIPTVAGMLIIQGTISILRTKVDHGVDKPFYEGAEDKPWFNRLTKALVMLLFWAFTVFMVIKWVLHVFILSDISVGRIILGSILTLIAIWFSFFASKSLWKSTGGFEEEAPVEQVFHKIYDQRQKHGQD